jgi:S-adenosylmethionine:tRNA ribosyltransferase-isomerase
MVKLAMQTSDFDFQVPLELIAHVPAAKRDHSRLMVLHRASQTIEHKHFFDIIEYLKPGDLLVINDTKVMPANLVGRKEEGGAKVEVLLVRPQTTDNRPKTWECLVKPGKRLKIGAKVVFGNGEVIGTVLEKTETGEQVIEFSGDLDKYMREKGQIPLPPYIKPLTPFSPSPLVRGKGIGDRGRLRDRYQTVYAQKEGAAAAPTAGLHFTPALLKKAETKGVRVATVTLHTGLATFKPIYADKIEDHKMHSEYFEIPEETIEAVKKAERVIAVGTTSVRALETMGGRLKITDHRPQTTDHGTLDTGRKGETKLFIYPGYKFKVVDAMITNFHWPRTSLILLVSAFAGKDFILRAYQEAINQNYRFFSFGDAMLIV